MHSISDEPSHGGHPSQHMSHSSDDDDDDEGGGGGRIWKSSLVVLSHSFSVKSRNNESMRRLFPRGLDVLEFNLYRNFSFF